MLMTSLLFKKHFVKVKTEKTLTTLIKVAYAYSGHPVHTWFYSSTVNSTMYKCKRPPRLIPDTFTKITRCMSFAV